jgi:hypothetical protein
VRYSRCGGPSRQVLPRGLHSSVVRWNGAAAHWFGAPFSPPLFLSPQPPPTSTIDPSGSSTVLACERGWRRAPRLMLVVSFHPLSGLRSSNSETPLVASASPSGSAASAFGLSEPPSCSTWCEPSGPAGSITAVPQTRLWVELPMSFQRSLGGLPSGENHQVSVVHGPATRPWPLGIQNRCG